jgi:hypothetical protein
MLAREQAAIALIRETGEYMHTATEQLSDLEMFSESLMQRIRAAARYKVFSSGLRLSVDDKRYWDASGNRNLDDGLDWPASLRKQTDPAKWPAFAFGVANAACVVVLPTPGMGGNGQEPGAYIGPASPNLGGIGHMHCRLWPSINRKNTWVNLERYVREAFNGLEDPWAAMMVMNLASTPRRTGITDSRELKTSVVNLELIVSVCRPQLIVLCGSGVKSATKNWKAPAGTKTVYLDHPSCWDGRMGKGRVHGDRFVELVRSRFFS